jgi:TRAP-type C4-dicarboxylate transport system permease small subunit
MAEAIVVVALLGELLVVLANIVARVFFQRSFLWSDEVARLVLSILAFVGGAVAYQRRDHAQVRFILNIAPKPVERICLALAEVTVFFVSALVCLVSLSFITASWAERTPILQVPAARIALPLPIGAALMTLFAAAHIWREHKRLSVVVGASFLVVILLAAVTYGSWLSLLGDDGPIIAALILFFAAIFAASPRSER